MPTYNYRQLTKLAAPPERFLVGGGLVPLGGLVFVGGPPKSYKSFLLLTMSLQMSCGIPIFNAHTKHAGTTTFRFPVVRPLKVLMLEQELGWIDDRERLDPMFASLSPEQRQLVSENLHIHAEPYGIDPLMRLDNEEVDRHPMAEVVASIMPDVLILDPLSMFHRQDENSAQDMGIVLRNLAVLRKRFNLRAVILSHHTSKPKHDGSIVMSDSPDMLRGSSVLFASGDSYMMVSRQKGDRIRIDFTLRRHRPITSMIGAVNEMSGMVEFQEWVMGGDRAGAGRKGDAVQ